MRHPGRNRSGQAHALTVLTPVLRGHESDLALHLDALPGGDGSPLARVPGTHFARWVLIDDVVYEGAGQKRDALSAPRLLFTSNHDGPPDPHLESIARSIPAEADGIWGHCAGYPGSRDARAFAAWLGAHQVESALFFAAYGDQTLDQVRANLATRARDRVRAAGHGARGGRLRAGVPEGLPGMTTTLDLAQIQGFVVRGYRLPWAEYLFLRVDDPVRARAWLAGIAPQVLTAAPWSVKPESGVNLAISYAGLEALGAPGTSLAGFPQELREGMAARAGLLGDFGSSAPSEWEAPFGTGDVHVLVMISAQDRTALEAHEGRLRAEPTG